MPRERGRRDQPDPPEPGSRPERVWRCCGGTFESEAAYERHIEREHDGERPGQKAYM